MGMRINPVPGVEKYKMVRIPIVLETISGSGHSMQTSVAVKPPADIR